MKRFAYTITFIFLIYAEIDAQIVKEVSSKDNFQKEFNVQPSELSSIGENNYFILNPGYQLILTGKDGGDYITLTITVLRETKLVDECTTRVVEEKEIRNNLVTEISKNYFAIHPTTKDIFYFGESVDIYNNNKIVSHEGSWESGKNGAKFGLMMPGKIEIGKKYYQEMAPKIAMDRAEIESTADTVQTKFRKYFNCLKVKETTPLEVKTVEYKYYVKSIGLIRDGNLYLTKVSK